MAVGVLRRRDRRAGPTILEVAVEIDRTEHRAKVEACIRKAVDDWKMHYDAADDGPTMPEFIATRLSIEGLLKPPRSSRSSVGRLQSRKHA